MKKLFIFLLFLTTSVFAQRVPLSEVERYLDGASRGVGVAGLYECKDKPKEQCIDITGVNLETSELVDEVLPDGTLSGLKKLAVSEAKAAAKHAKERAASDEREAKELKKKAAIEVLKKADLSKITTVKDLRDIVQKLLDAQE